MKKSVINVVGAAAILFLSAFAFGYTGQENDEAVIQKAIEAGILESHPFPLEGRPWAEWVNNSQTLFDFRSNAIVRWDEMAEVTDMTEEQRAKAKALHQKYKKLLHDFKEETNPVIEKIGEREKEARETGNSEVANTLRRVGHVQTHQKLAIEGGASEDLYRLLNEEQLETWHEYRVTKHAVHKMRRRTVWRKIGDSQFDKILDLSDEQMEQIESMLWETAEKEFLPTIDDFEEISALAIYRENEKHAFALGEKVYPEVVEKVLTDEQRAKLEAAKKD